MQLLLTIITGLAAIAAALAICRAGAVLRCPGSSVTLGFLWMMEETPALFSRVIFILCAFKGLMATCRLLQISKHAVLSLDMVFLFNKLLPILYQTLTASANSSCKAVFA